MSASPRRRGGVAAALATGNFGQPDTQQPENTPETPENDKPKLKVVENTPANTHTPPEEPPASVTPAQTGAARRERGKKGEETKGARDVKTFRAFAEESDDLVYAMMDEIRKSDLLTRKQANRIGTSAIIRCALRIASKTKPEVIIKQLLDHDDFSGN